MQGIKIAQTEWEIRRVYAVMAQLRPHLAKEEFVERVRAQMDEGYSLAYLEDDGKICTVAGFRIGCNLACGRFFYVDDLVTDEALRARGHGQTLLEWLLRRAQAEGCAQFHLDCASERTAAHRFYQRLGLRNVGYHFVKPLGKREE